MVPLSFDSQRISNSNDCHYISKQRLQELCDRFQVDNFLTVSYCTSWLWSFCDSWFPLEVFQSQTSATTDLSEFTLLANDERIEGSWFALLTCFLRLPLSSQEPLFNKNGESLPLTLNKLVGKCLIHTAKCFWKLRRHVNWSSCQHRYQ